MILDFTYLSTFISLCKLIIELCQFFLKESFLHTFHEGLLLQPHFLFSLCDPFLSSIIIKHFFTSKKRTKKPDGL